MFTGLIESVGAVRAVRRGDGSAVLTIEPTDENFSTKIGDSVAVNGVCLTIEHYRGRAFELRAVFETLQKTTLGSLKNGDMVNLERAMVLGGRLDGHIVQGHVDTVGRLVSVTPAGDSLYYTFSVPHEFTRYMVSKGSVAVDGISLTIARMEGGLCTLSLIPHTISHTTLRFRKAGDSLNIECDLFARYIEKILSYKTEESSSTGSSLLTLLEGGLY